MALAAHQPMWTLWNLCAFCNTPVEQAAMAFMPGAQGPVARLETAKVIVGCGVVVGAAVSCVACGLPAVAPQWFSPDATLWPLMRMIAPQVCTCCRVLVATPCVQGTLALLLAGLDVSSSGVLMSRRDYAYLARAMLVSLALLAAFLGACAVRGAVGLPAVWWGLVVFFGARAVQSVTRLWLIRRDGGWGGACVMQS